MRCPSPSESIPAPRRTAVLDGSSETQCVLARASSASLECELERCGYDEIHVLKRPVAALLLRARGSSTPACRRIICLARFRWASAASARPQPELNAPCFRRLLPYVQAQGASVQHERSLLLLV